MLSVFDRYLAREVGAAFAAGLGLFLAVVTFVQLFKLVDSTAGLGFGGAELLAAAGYAMPPILGLLLPITWLYACLLGIGRLGQDRELLALAQSGIGLPPLWRVPLWGGTLLGIVTAALLGFAEPWGVAQLSALLTQSAQRALTQGMAPNRFHGVGTGFTLFAAKRQGQALAGLLLADNRAEGPALIVQAAHADVRRGETAHEVLFCLRDGAVLLPARDPLLQGRQLVRFARGSYRIDAATLVRIGRRTFTDEQGLRLAELWRRTRPRLHDDAQHDVALARLRVALQRKFALPVAAPLFGALAVPLALGARGAARARSLLCCSLVVGCYYYVGRSLELAARHGALSPLWAAWAPNLLGLMALLVALARLRGRRL